MDDADDAEVRALLAVATCYDNRRAGEAAVTAWAEAARRGRWTFDAAVEAIHEHYATSTDFLMPGHITAAIRARMRQPEPARQTIAELEAAAPASEETRRRFAALMADRFALPTRIRERRERRAQRRSAGHVEARERARRELDRIRPEEPPEDVVG
jgi:hypothetical protein